jgi:hypothetical protein
MKIQIKSKTAAGLNPITIARMALRLGRDYRRLAIILGYERPLVQQELL